MFRGLLRVYGERGAFQLVEGESLLELDLEG
jgi:hypothetical protein